ncbi:MAG: TMEM175 family protein [Rhodomicrobium sp.]
MCSSGAQQSRDFLPDGGRPWTQKHESGVDKSNPGTEHITAFSDGVIAIIITIMVLELKLPENAAWGAWSAFLAPLATNARSLRTSLEAKAVLQGDKLEAVADRGYFNGEEIAACEARTSAAGIFFRSSSELDLAISAIAAGMDLLGGHIDFWDIRETIAAMPAKEPATKR